MPKSPEGNPSQSSSTEKQLEFSEKFPDALMVLFENDGGTVKRKLDKPAYLSTLLQENELTFITTESEIGNFVDGVKDGLKNDGWKKVFICANSELAHKLADEIPTLHFENLRSL